MPPPSAPGRVPQDGTGPASCLGRPAVSSKAPECPLVPWPTRQTLSEALGGGDFLLGQTWKLRPSARGAGCAPRWPSELAPRSPSDRRNWRGPVLKPGPTRGAGSSWGLMVMGEGQWQSRVLPEGSAGARGCLRHSPGPGPARETAPGSGPWLLAPRCPPLGPPGPVCCVGAGSTDKPPALLLGGLPLRLGAGSSGSADWFREEKTQGIQEPWIWDPSPWGQEGLPRLAGGH